MQEGAQMPYLREGQLSHSAGDLLDTQQPRRAKAIYPDPLPIDYGPLLEDLGHYIPRLPSPYVAHAGRPYSGSLPIQYGSPLHALGPRTHVSGPPYGPLPQDNDPLDNEVPFPYRGPPRPYSIKDPEFINNFNSVPYGQVYQHEEGEFKYEYEDDEDDEDDESAAHNLEEALMEVNIQLPRLTASVPASVLPPKGGGVCGLPNLGNTCYLNAVLQCLYHIPRLPALLAKASHGLQDKTKEKNNVAQALNIVMTKMDDVSRLKKGMLAYFKGVCCLRDEKFASEGQQEAHDLVAGLLLWLQKDLASQDVDCACTKTLMKKHKASTTTTNTKKGYSTSQDTPRHHPNSYQYQPPANKDSLQSYNIYTGSTHDYTQYQHKYRYDRNHCTKSLDYQGSKDKEVLKKQGELCMQCGVTYQYRSLISDLFEGILQREIICPKTGLILLTVWERFTSLSLPITGSSDITLEEALEKYFQVSTFVWDCEYCASTHACHQQTRVLSAPPILIIHLSRYTEEITHSKQNVVFPVDGLNLTPHMKSKMRAPLYDLHGVCSHHGTREAGHYTAFCWAIGGRDKPEGWYDFDDAKVGRVSRFRHSREAHILFYSVHGFTAVHG